MKILLLSGLFFFSSCSLLPTALPEKMPDDFFVYYHLSGGMLDYSEDFKLSIKEGLYQVSEGGKMSRIDFTLSIQELQKIYQSFYQNSFDRIGTSTQEVYDRGGVSISLQAEGESYFVSNSGIYFVSSFSKDDWYRIVSMFHEKIRNLKRTKGLKVEFVLDDSIKNLKGFYFGLGTDPFAEKVGLDSYVFYILKGVVRFYLYFEGIGGIFQKDLNIQKDSRFRVLYQKGSVFIEPF